MGKQFSLLKSNAVQIVLQAAPQKQTFQSAPYTVESHKKFVLTLKLFKEQENAAFVATRVMHVDCISFVVPEMHQQITEIIYTALTVQYVLAKLMD